MRGRDKSRESFLHGLVSLIRIVAASFFNHAVPPFAACCGCWCGSGWSSCQNKRTAPHTSLLAAWPAAPKRGLTILEDRSACCCQGHDRFRPRQSRSKKVPEKIPISFCVTASFADGNQHTDAGQLRTLCELSMGRKNPAPTLQSTTPSCLHSLCHLLVFACAAISERIAAQMGST